MSILSTLLFLICLHTGMSKKPEESTEAQNDLIIQTPTSLNVVEGTNLRMECKIKNANESKKWFIDWYANKRDGKIRLMNTSSISILKNVTDGWSSLILLRPDVTDSGIYTCDFGVLDRVVHSSNGTQVTVTELTDLMVNQTPGYTEKEGANVTIECSFSTVSDYSTMYVRWHKDGKNLTLKRDSLTMIQDLERGFASLTLKNTKKDDSGSYVCEVGSRSRNLSGSGNPSHVVIKETGEKKLRTTFNNRTGEDGAGDGTGAGIGVGAGVGAGVGVILLALLIGFFVSRRKQSSQGAPLATLEPEGVSTKQGRIQHPPLTSQASDVTYADLHFHKRDMKPDAEVVYAEVKVGRK